MLDATAWKNGTVDEQSKGVITRLGGGGGHGRIWAWDFTSRATVLRGSKNVQMLVNVEHILCVSKSCVCIRLSLGQVLSFAFTAHSATVQAAAAMSFGLGRDPRSQGHWAGLQGRNSAGWGCGGRQTHSSYPLT